MAKFKNSKGVEFELVVTVKTLQVCKQELEFDLAKLMYPGSNELAKITADPIIMCDLCYLVSQHRIPKEERVKFEDFLDGLAGDALDEAMNAMLDAIADFYPRPEQRAFLRDLKKKAIGVTAKAFEEAQIALSKIPTAEILKTETTENTPATIDASNSPSVSTTTAESPTSPSEPLSSASNSPPSSDSAPANSAT